MLVLNLTEDKGILRLSPFFDLERAKPAVDLFITLNGIKKSQPEIFFITKNFAKDCLTLLKTSSQNINKRGKNTEYNVCLDFKFKIKS